MSKAQTDCAGETRSPAADPPPLSPNLRRHLGRNLRAFYADAIGEPLGERIEALLGRLDKTRR
ncbi:hypothetical protein OCOJLMKI_4780 [Methylobacterium iners]|uniref:Anti-sigma factor NepR domain-containing protein n=2 Tax=Methylobacterium iners TaxID=418707 RepID=A0ABQ4S6W9_9HYPH|nr:hypothetical protein OCOJLMKI_4780 [Methylobacterium iners]